MLLLLSLAKLLFLLRNAPIPQLKPLPDIPSPLLYPMKQRITL